MIKLLNITIITMASFLSTLFGCTGQDNKSKTTEIFPPESFSVLEATMANGKPCIGSFNMAYKKYDQKAKYPWCLKIAIGLELEHLFENGLPKNEESAVANKLEDELLAEIQKLSTAHYVGHLFNDKFLDVYIYLDDPKKAHDFLQSQVDNPGLARGFGYEINNDPKWETVKPFLK